MNRLAEGLAVGFLAIAAFLACGYAASRNIMAFHLLPPNDFFYPVAEMGMVKLALGGALFLLVGGACAVAVLLLMWALGEMIRDLVSRR